MKKLTIASCLLSLIFLIGCVESSFELSEESRLPKWFTLNDGLTRKDVTVTLDYYLFPTEKSVFKLMDKNRNILSEKKGERVGGYLEPKTLKDPPPGFPAGYPSYEIIGVDGIIDIIEHRKMEPVFYITDDPDVRRELGVKQ